MDVIKKGLVICLLIILGCESWASDRGFQLWNLNNVEVVLNEKISVGASEKIQYRTESGLIGLKYGDVYVHRKVGSWLDMGLSGRILWMNEEKGWVQENRPMVYGTLKKRMGCFSFNFTNRMEYRMFEHLDNHFRHRHMLALEAAPLNQSNHISLYFSEEAFYLLNEERFHLFRLYSGTKIRCNKFLEMKIYYVFEKLRKQIGWNPSDVVGLDIKIKI